MIRFNPELFAEAAANCVHLERFALQAQFDAGSEAETEWAKSVRRHACGLRDALKNLPARSSTPATGAPKAP